MKKILKDYKAGKIDLNDVLEKIKSLPYEDLEFVKIDTHRSVRKGFPETIFCQGKTIPQILKIIEMMIKKDHNILATKANKKIFNEIKKKYPNANYNELAKTIVIKNDLIPHQPKIKVLRVRSQKNEFIQSLHNFPSIVHSLLITTAPKFRFSVTCFNSI